MANKVITHSYNGMVQDISKSKFPNEYYFEGRNIRIVATDTQSTGSITNEKGNSLILEIPVPSINTGEKKIYYDYNSVYKILSYTNEEIDTLESSGFQRIIGHSNSRHYILLFTTDDNGSDCIWKLGYEDYDLTLLYIRNMSFSIDHPIQVLNNFENKNIDKVYWVDSLNQLRFINIEHSIANQDLEELIDVPLNAIQMTGKFELSQPIITDVSTGGVHTAGMIQYAYNLYRINGSQTKISPLSELIALDKGILGGGAVNESVSTTPNVTVNNIDQSYTNIRLYSIKYTSFNELPTISLIVDAEISSSGTLNYYDDGKIISTLSVDEFTFLGSDIIVPKHIASKFNRLFLANYKEINFNVDLDTRAYSYNSSSLALVYTDLFLDDSLATPFPNGTEFIINDDSDYDNPLLIKHDSVNLNYNTFKYQVNGSTLGGEGKYLKYTLTQTSAYNENARYFKDNEIYRLGIIFYNIYGQVTEPKWIADFKAPRGNLRGKTQVGAFPINNGSYNTLSVTLKPAFYTWLEDTTFETDYDKPVGYKFVIAERTLNDRTIVANGLITPMLVDHKTTSDESSITTTTANTLEKLPNILVRNVNPATDVYGNVKPLKASSHLAEMSNGSHTSNTEVQRAYDSGSDRASKLYQYSTMFQMYSPEIMFGSTAAISSSLTFNVVGSIQNTENNAWARVYEHDINKIIAERKFTGGVSSFYASPPITTTGDDDGFAYGLISHPPGSDAGKATHNMTYRLYGNINQVDNTHLNAFQYNQTITDYDVYGTPLVTEKGQSGTNYNNDTNFRFINSLESVSTDGDSSWDDDGRYGRKIISISSYGNRCLTFVLGSDDPSTVTDTRPKLETLFSDGVFTTALFPIANQNVGLIGEFVKSDIEIYLGNLYGGNTYEDKTRTNYIEIGEYQNIDSLIPTIAITSPGDTFVRNFRFARIVRTDVDTYAQGYFRLEEIVEFTTETTVDLKNRNDLSLSSWDVRFQPQDAEFHSYNKVYSQLPTLTKHRGLGYNIKKLNNLDTNIIATKLKHNGELIDSWTDLSINDTLSLDGKHGSINSLISFNDEIFTIQDKALAAISINPRVQVQGSDGLSLQLGTGQVLDRYKYISTDHGTLNKWSVVTTPSGLYFYDLLNKDIIVYNGTASSLTDVNGMHTYFNNHSTMDLLKFDNPNINKGVSAGYDYTNNDVFMTFLQGVDSFTIAFNELKGKFTSFYDYLPSMYISKGQYFITTNPTINKLYRQYAGDYCKYYEAVYPSSITLNVNPEANQDCVFDNINFKSEVYLNGVDQPTKTLTSIRAYNDYQDSLEENLVVGRNGNIRRKFRDWNANIPRDGRNRIRAPWIKLQLKFNNANNYKFVMHDTSIYYTVS